MPLEKGLVIVHNRLSHDMYQLEFISPEMAARSKPGQFLQVKVNALNTPLLRRPISIYDVDKSLGSITLLYKVVGQGTEAMSRIRTKEYLDVMGPLGQGFNTSPPGRKILLIGGGVGIAPLVYLARVLKAKNYQVKVLHGADSRRNLVAFEKLREIGVDFLPATDDGSAGFKGLVTDLLATKLKASQIDYIYTCGPDAMMKTVAAYANANQIPGQVSLEEHMACGVGACLGCARQLKSSDREMVKICKDGPVFDIQAVEFSVQGEVSR
ncbi:MAG TPA: dihydroorotate dehydrogenase electron transfer subunit [Syntrophomonadaceae bacterium]|mgnify:CR=1 FL=1|jgi:dihydroorotate dehydrogenase electron transfer subunit|nr:dihydroorotate dehydrogenase electron transfer subunit [Syntrophomonadaceae bacterium]HRX21200.1 dihydroorotate dehydrogenase electron transfer subunit [Syntrophomonadaceae bacterium]